jgi:effector-binding domain-containing protein
MCLFRFLFLSELGTCPQNLMPTRGVEPLENHQFPQGGMLKFIYKGRFLTIKLAYEKFLD